MGYIVLDNESTCQISDRSDHFPLQILQQQDLQKKERKSIMKT